MSERARAAMTLLQVALAAGLADVLGPAALAQQTAPAVPDGEEPALMGRMMAPEVLHHSSAYEEEFSTYEPDAGPVEIIASLEVELSIEVVWGSWCSDSTREVPHFFKILERAQEVRDRQGVGPLPILTEFVGVDREKIEPANLLEGKFIERIPTFIVRRGGQEVGRIVETPLGLLEEDLAVLILEASTPVE